MKNWQKSFRNFSGLITKIAVFPLLLKLMTGYMPSADLSGSTLILSSALILIGLTGLILSDLFLMRFGNGQAHFSSGATRLVRVGYYARNRHPFFWFLTIYHAGMVCSFYGITLFSALIWLVFTFPALLFLIFYQERKLLRSFGERYCAYQRSTPLWYWKLNIAENQRVKVLAMVTWVLGLLVVRNWFKFTVEGEENIPHDQPFLVIANHESYLDPFVFGLFVPFEIQFVTTADVFANPIMRFLLKGIGTLPMRRHRQDLKSIRTMIRMINRGQVVGIFPEGGRSIDGSPLPILNETLKLIQRCKVPILPVHIDGAYEMWPRWTAAIRRGTVSASFRPMIPVEDQADLGQLKSKIEAAIFAAEKIYKPVKRKALTTDLRNVLWACCNCFSHDSIEEISNNEVRCSQCETSWDVSSNYTLTEKGTSNTHTHASWIQRLNKNILNQPKQLELMVELDQNEQGFLSTPINKYMTDDDQEIVGELSVTLTNHRFLLSRGDKIIASWSLGDITIFTMDFSNSISIGVGGIRHTFVLPASEVLLKWQSHFDILSAN